MKTLLCNGTIITPEGPVLADMLLDGGRISAIGKYISREGAITVDASNKLLLPGGVDIHTHITLNIDAVQGTDVFYTGTIPAAAGGTTTIVDHLAFAPEGRSLREQISMYQNLSSGQSTVDYGFHAVAQNMDAATQDTLADLAAQGITSVKAYMTYAQRLDDEQLFQLLLRCKQLGLLLAVHAEAHDCVNSRITALLAQGKGAPRWHPVSRPAECEAKAVARLLRLAAEAGNAPVHVVHLSTAAGLAEIRKARSAGQTNIFVETCTQYLLLTEDKYQDDSEGLRYIMSPPLRDLGDVDALWQGVQGGDIQAVATDHCSFTLADKSRGIGNFTRCPGGAPGLEERFTVLFSEGVSKGRLSITDFAELVAANPAKITGLYPKKGALQPGSDADVVILDPAARHTLRAASMHGPGDFSLYEGLEVQGGIEAVYLRGELVAREGRFTGRRGAGHYLERERYRQTRQ